MDSQINVGGDFGKPVNTFIEKISDAIEGVAKPRQIVRLAKAQRKADLIEVRTKIEIAEEQIRAINRLAAEETIKQRNMDSILQKAIPLLEEGGNPDEMDNDWIVNFFNKSRHISDEEMQMIWARILAGEANAPGSFSRRTINFLDNLDKKDALYFKKFCDFCWDSDGALPFIYDEAAEIYANHGLDFHALSHLDTIGLINFSSMGEYVEQTSQPDTYRLSYNDTTVVVSIDNGVIGDKNHPYSFSTGKAVLTETGREISRIVTKEPVEGFPEYIIKIWEEKNYIVNIVNNVQNC